MSIELTLLQWMADRNAQGHLEQAETAYTTALLDEEGLGLAMLLAILNLLKDPGEFALAVRAGFGVQGTTAWCTNFEALRTFGILSEAELGAISARDGSFLPTLVRPSTQADQDTGR